MRGADQAVLRADRLRVILHCLIAGQHQMIAVVDLKAGCLIVIGAAATAGLGGRLVHDNPDAGSGQADCGGKSGKSGADNVNSSRHQTNAYFATIHNRRRRLMRARVRGAVQPRATVALKMIS